MPNKNTWIIIIFLLILASLVVLIGRSLRQGTASVSVPAATSSGSISGPAASPADNNFPTVTSTSEFAAPAPADTKVPSAGEILPAAEQKVIAVPTTVVPAAPGATTQFRTFNITAQGGYFTPYKIIANVGDTVHINFTAMDKTYDITFPSYGMKQTAQPGQTKVLEFLAQQSGTFQFYCDSCGGPTSTARGQIIIAK